MNHPLTAAVPDPQRGFLPAADPLRRLPEDFEAWDEAAAELPKLMLGDRLREHLERLPPFHSAQLESREQCERAMLVLSFLGHAYVWGGERPADRLPARLAVPWQRVARRLGRPPVLSYASYALHNWRRLDPPGPVALGNIALLQNFLGGLDEEWFVLVHVDIEARAAPALRALPAAQEAVAHGDADALAAQLHTVAATLDAMIHSLVRMPEHCDPYIYYTRVRPYIHGWKDNPGLPRGLIYEGVKDYAGEPCRLRGETGAQSAIVPALDAALGVAHGDDPLRRYLLEMRDYMPPEQRAFVAMLEGGLSIRDYVLRHRDLKRLRMAYNACLDGLDRFRSTHLEYAGRYVHRQHQCGEANPTAVGTGGTPFMDYLAKHRQDTRAALLREGG